MARSLRKADKLVSSDLDDAPPGKWKDKLVDGINALVDATDQIRSTGLASRVGSSVTKITFSTKPDWEPVIFQDDWASALSDICSVASCRKFDNGMAAFRGGLQWKRVSLNYTAFQLPQAYMYPDKEYTGYIANGSNVIYRMDIYSDGFMRLDKGGITPAAATTFIPMFMHQWQCADPRPPPHLASPILMAHGLDGAPGVVYMRNVFVGTNDSFILPEPSISWVRGNDSQIQINNILGLPGGLTYSAEVVCIQE
jgi:hypothetical protein